MNKIFWGLVILLLGIMQNANSLVQNINKDESKSKSIHHESGGIIGGISAPEFFTKYDINKVKLIANSSAKSIEILYPPKLKKLALKVKYGILSKNKSRVKIKLTPIVLKDTLGLKFRYDAVVVVLYF